MKNLITTKVSKKQLRQTKQRVKTAKGRKNSSTHWIQRHINDPYVTLAKQKGYRSRAAFKLLQIDEKFNVFKDCQCVVDLGSAPGSWLQVAKQKCPSDSNIVGIDLQEIEPVEGVHFIHGDFYDPDKLKQLVILIPDKVDVVISDMAASSCGNKQTDHLKITALLEAALEFAIAHLKPGGHFVAKILRGKYESESIHNVKMHFQQVKTFKPDASYKDSAEIFIIGRNFLGPR